MSTTEGKADAAAVEEMARSATAWCAMHGLVVGDRADPRSGTVPGVGLVHAPISLLPSRLPESFWSQACELAPLFNELVDRVSLDGDFLQDSLSKTRQVDDFTSRLLDIHRKMMDANKEENIRLGLHRSDYMLDSETNSLLQIELNTISVSFPGLCSIVTELHRTLINQYGNLLCLDAKRVPGNDASRQFAKALAKAWDEFNVDSAVVMMIVQPEERNMYDQYWLVKYLRESHGITTIRKTLSEVEAEGQVLLDGTLVVNDRKVAVVYFRAGYTPNDYPSEAEWNARLLMEQSSAVKCPSISYHLVGTKKIQQELAKPNVLERFLENKEEIAKLRQCFAGLWSLDDEEVVKSAIENPDLFVLKPQREGGGNNIYGFDVREALIRLKKEGGDALSAYILMQRIFPKASLASLVRGGVCHEALTVSELGIYGAYLRNKDKVIINDKCGYLMRTKVSSSDEGGVAAGFAVLDSLYLTDK
ncbi:glutathione synthetase, chloroplastic isoform X2 [Triticum urartu]|nr:glutathione synthetase, chloroplastic isoform X2 [Triticum urartu]